MYLNNWKNFDDMKDDFWPSYGGHEYKDELDGVTILLASYTYYSYEGDAFVLFRRDGKLYEVNGSHCSCYGLEGQWEPEETTAEALRQRMDKGELGRSYYGGANKFANELQVVLEGLAL